MERRAAVEVLESLEASLAALAVVVRGAGSAPPHTVAGSGEADPLRQLADDFLDGLAEASRLDAKLAALKVRLASGYSGAAQAMTPAASPQGRVAQEMAIVAEVACVLTVGERTAAALLCEAHELTTALPLTLSALQAGSISWQHARVMVDETANLEPVVAAALEAHFLDPGAPNPARGGPAGELVASRFRHKARTWRERHHPVSIEKRHARSLADRRLECRPDRDGMAWLSAYLPAAQAAGIWNRATAAARVLQGPGETRTVTQLRADLAATWLLTNNSNGTTDETGATGEVGGMAGFTGTSGGTGMTGGSGAATGTAGTRITGMTGVADMTGEVGAIAVDGGVPSPRAQVLVTVPVFSLLGLTDEPAMLDGYGPIPPSMARQLIADGAESFHRVLIDPRDGAPLEIGRTSYRVTKAQRQWLRLRDGKCPFPGCSNHSLDNEADHLLAWHQGGTTGISNLDQPCPKHHRLRHTSTWTPTTAGPNEPPAWISPTGRHYASEHPDWEQPEWPHQVLEQLGHQEIGPDPQYPPMPEGLPKSEGQLQDHS